MKVYKIVIQTKRYVSQYIVKTKREKIKWQILVKKYNIRFYEEGDSEIPFLFKTDVVRKICKDL